MSEKVMYVLITKMHVKLNEMIERSNYNLLDNEVQLYSQKLDKVLIRYSRECNRRNRTAARLDGLDSNTA